MFFCECQLKVGISKKTCGRTELMENTERAPRISMSAPKNCPGSVLGAPCERQTSRGLSRGNQRADFGSPRSLAILMKSSNPLEKKAYRAVAKRRGAYAAMLLSGRPWERQTSLGYRGVTSGTPRSALGTPNFCLA